MFAINECLDRLKIQLKPINLVNMPNNTNLYKWNPLNIVNFMLIYCKWFVNFFCKVGISMGIEMFCGEFHFAALDFVFKLLDEINTKIQKKILFYEEQIFSYARRQLDYFFLTVCLTPAVLFVYKNELWSTLAFKLKHIVKEKQVFRCAQ